MPPFKHHSGSKHRASPDVPVPITWADGVLAWQTARRHKRCSQDQLRFEARWLDALHTLVARLRAGQWWPSPAVCFAVRRPKTREVHAPAFADRIVHHWLVWQLEPLFEPLFIHDSHANRHGHGTHVAVRRLTGFMQARQQAAGGHAQAGWYLKLDVANYFNSIHRPTLYGLLKRRIAQAQARRQLSWGMARALCSLCHRLLLAPVVAHELGPALLARVPAHKRLRNAQPGCGVPIGNLTSQFFANVYLNELDQFVKRQLGVRHYLRYVDDMVLLGDAPAQLLAWRSQIAQFLQQRLGLRLKDAGVLAPQHQGIDFLGYRVFAQHRGVRPRVLGHLREHLHAFAASSAAASACTRLGSYWGHFAHANSARLRAALFVQFPWLGWLFGPQPGRPQALQPLWVPADAWHLQAHAAWCARHWPQARCCMQEGWGWRVWPAATLPQQPEPPELLALPLGPRWLMGTTALHRWTTEQRAQGRPYVRLDQTGYLRHGARLRTVCDWFGLPPPVVPPVWAWASAPALLCSTPPELNISTFPQELCNEDF